MKKDLPEFVIHVLTLFLFIIATNIVFNKVFPTAVKEEAFVQDELQEGVSIPSNLVVAKPPVTKSFSINEMGLSFDEKTGALIDLSLKDYTTSSDSDENVATLFKRSLDEQTFSGDFLVMIDEISQHLPFKNITFDYDETSQVVVVVKENGVMKVKETYTPDAKHSFSKSTTVTNTTKKPASFYYFFQFKNTKKALLTGTENGVRMFQGASFHTDKTKYKKVPFSQFNKTHFEENSSTGGWVGVSQRYFVSAVSCDYPGRFYNQYNSVYDAYNAGHISDRQYLDSGESMTLEQRVYSGPEKNQALKEFAPTLEFVIDYGILWPICSVIVSLLGFFHGFVANWGLVIICLTVTVRLLLAGLAKKQVATTALMQRIQPKITEITERYKDDAQKKNEALVALYKKENFNPLTNTLSLLMMPLIQIPTFLSMYFVLMEYIGLRQAPFYGWIVDLSLADPHYILPFVVGASVFIQQKLSPKATNETMATMGTIMPFMMVAICFKMPAGLCVYWFSNNLCTMLQLLVVKNVTTPK